MTLRRAAGAEWGRTAILAGVAALLAACAPVGGTARDAADAGADGIDAGAEADHGVPDDAPDAAPDVPPEDFALDDAPVDAPDAPAADDAPGDAGDEPADAEAGDTGPDALSGPCPPLMAYVEHTFCIDLYEGALEEQNPDGSWTPASPYYTVGDRVVRAVPAAGIYPQGYISGIEAEAACEASGKRLCTSAEWLAACQGPDGLTWPYGDTHIDGACNDHYAGTHPVVDYFGTSDGVWDMDHMNNPGINQQPGTIARGGEFSACVSQWHVYDMHGNLHEWVADADGTFRGGFYADASLNGPGCLYATTAHTSTYHDYSTGFRCCADP